MRLNLNDRYFEYTPPERCECDCGSPHHWDDCATQVGLYLGQKLVVFEPEFLEKTFLSNLVDAIKKHPLHQFLSKHRLTSNDFKTNIIKSSYDDTKNIDLWFEPHYNKPFTDLFTGVYDWGDFSVIMLEFGKDKNTGRVYLKASRPSRIFEYREAKKIMQTANTNVAMQQCDFITGKKQYWLNGMRVVYCYDLIFETILADALNEVVPQFFKEQA